MCIYIYSEYSLIRSNWFGPNFGRLMIWWNIFYGDCSYITYPKDTSALGELFPFSHEKSKIPFCYMLYAYSVKRAYRGTKPKESFR